MILIFPESKDIISIPFLKKIYIMRYALRVKKTKLSETQIKIIHKFIDNNKKRTGNKN